MAISSSIITISQVCEAESCLLQWSVVHEDNNSPDCFLADTAYYIRLYRTPLTLLPADITVFNTSGSVTYVSTEEESVIEEFVTFQGDQVARLDKPFYQTFTFTTLGIYNASGQPSEAITFGVTEGSNEIRASAPCFGTILVNYITQYLRYRFVGTFYESTPIVVVSRQIVIGALAICNNETIRDAAIVEIMKRCAADDSGCLELTDPEVDTSSDEGAAYDKQGKKLIKVYVEDPSYIAAYCTRGSITWLGTDEDTIEEEIAGMGGNFSASFHVYNLISQEVSGGNVNTLEVINGNLSMIRTPEDAVINGIPIGYGTVRIKYLTRYQKYLIAAAVTGMGVFIVHDLVGINCDYASTTYQLGVETVTNRYDITLVFKDFVTGEPVPLADVWVDDVPVGQTDGNGEVFIRQVLVDVDHTVRAKKEGYIDTYSDSLANDVFRITSPS